jgi:hypothetical protein
VAQLSTALVKPNMKTNTITTIVLAGFLAFSLAGCSKSPTPQISERTEPPLDQEAVALAEKGSLETWTQVGDSWFTWFRQYTNDSVFIQIKTVTHDVTPERLSEADTLNGLQWKGEVAFNYRVYRAYYEQVKGSPQVPQWGPWGDRQPEVSGPLFPSNYKFTKKNGQWTLVSYRCGYPNQFFTKPSEEQIKKILPQ